MQGPLLDILASAQLLTKKACEHLVKAIPLLAAVDCRDEQVGIFHPTDHFPAIALSAERIAQLDTERLQNARTQQEILQLWRLAHEHLVGEIVGVLFDRKRSIQQRPRAFLTTDQSQCSQLNSRRPAFCSLVQVLHVDLWQSVELGLLQKGTGFFETESQFACIQLHSLAIGSQAVDVEHWQLTRANHQALRRPQHGKQSREQAEDIGIVDCMQVVEKQSKRLVAGGYLLSQLHRICQRTVRHTHWRMLGTLQDRRHGCTQVGDEATELVVGTLKR
ncbi:hypothetical protein D3C84_111970 [compost metagenome]